jgi:hypothetical protein
MMGLGLNCGNVGVDWAGYWVEELENDLVLGCTVDGGRGK